MKFFALFFCGLFAVDSAIGQIPERPPLSASFAPAAFTNAVGTVLPYRLHRASVSNDPKPWPLVVFLHGSGECGTNNLSQIDATVSTFMKTYWRKPPASALLLAPQCSARQRWVQQLAMKPDYRFPRYPAPALRAVKDLCDELIASGDADPDRVYLIGTSLGAFGTWDAAMRWPDFFAAVIPMCGGGASSDPKLFKLLAKVPVWAFHGDKDGNVDVACTRRMITGLKKAGASPKYTEYPETGHVIWNRAMSDPKVIEWLFEQSKKKKEGGVSGWLKGIF